MIVMTTIVITMVLPMMIAVTPIMVMIYMNRWMIVVVCMIVMDDVIVVVSLMIMVCPNTNSSRSHVEMLGERGGRKTE